MEGLEVKFGYFPKMAAKDWANESRLKDKELSVLR